jgi:ribosomal-protein-alanine N-acetyltransferase
VNEIPTILTPRLILRALALEDAPALYRIHQTEGMLQYFPNPTPPPLERIERFIASQQAHWEKYGYGHWAITLPGQPDLIGWVGLQFLPETSETEVAYLVDRAYWGKGYATEAAKAALSFGFDRFDFSEIIALVHPENTRSLNVAARCGFEVVERKTYWGLELVRHTLPKNTPAVRTKQ